MNKFIFRKLCNHQLSPELKDVTNRRSDRKHNTRSLLSSCHHVRSSLSAAEKLSG